MMEDRDDNVRRALKTLSVLAPTDDEIAAPASETLARIKRQTMPQSRVSTQGRLNRMFGRKYVWAALTALVLIVVIVSIPGVRAATSDFLGIFRVQKFAPISISSEQLALLMDIAGSGLYPGEIEMIDEPGPGESVESLDAAAVAAGWHPQTLRVLGKPDEIVVVDGGSGSLTVNVESARALVQAAGADPAVIPDSLDGAVVELTIYPAVTQSWSDGFNLVQSPSPLVEYPDEVDTAALGEALLQALGMDSRQARRLARSIDWTSTVLLPIPENMATFSEIEIDGVVGLALGSLDSEHNTLLWQKDGMVYILNGGQVDELVEIGNSLR